MGYNIPALEKLIDEFRKMPSVGTKSAERMAFIWEGVPVKGPEGFQKAYVRVTKK